MGSIMALPSVLGRTLVHLAGTSMILGVLAGPVAAQQPQRADTTDLGSRQAKALFVRGLTQSYLEDYADAITQFEKALELAPQQPALLAALAEAEVARDNVTSGLYYARQAREKAPDQPHYYRLHARLLDRAGRSRQAADTYRTLLSRFPDQDDAYLPLARLLRSMDQPTQALRAYRALVDSTSRPPLQAYDEMLRLYEETGVTDGREEILQTLISVRRAPRPYRKKLGQLYIEQNRYREAISVYETLLRNQPSNLQLLSRLQTLYQRTGQSEKAETVWKTIAPSATSPDQLVPRARSLYEQARRNSAPLDSGAVAPALQLLRQALDQSPDHGPALHLLGTIQYERGAYDKAASLLQRAIDANPRDPERWGRLASAHLEAGHPQRAVNAAEEGLLLFPGHPALLRPLAFARLRGGEYNAALTRFQEALDKVGPDGDTTAMRAALHAGRGRAYARLDRPDRATADYRAALELDSDHPMALRHYALFLADRKKNLNRALQLAHRGASARPNDPNALDTLGWVHYKRGALSEAERYLRKAVNAGPVPAVVYDHFGEVQRALGNDRLAREYWKKALEIDPERTSVRQKLRALPQS
jgi:tetratricopeptide (TPR) repeat protein